MWSLVAPPSQIFIHVSVIFNSKQKTNNQTNKNHSHTPSDFVSVLSLLLLWCLGVCSKTPLQHSDRTVASERPRVPFLCVFFNTDGPGQSRRVFLDSPPPPLPQAHTHTHTPLALSFSLRSFHYPTSHVPYHITTRAQHKSKSPSSFLNTPLLSKRDERKKEKMLLYQILVEASGRCHSPAQPVGIFFHT